MSFLVHNVDGTAAEIESDDSDRGPSRTGCGSSVRQALAKRLTIQVDSLAILKISPNHSSEPKGCDGSYSVKSICCVGFTIGEKVLHTLSNTRVSSQKRVKRIKGHGSLI